MPDPRVWIAGPGELDRAAELLTEFRDTFGNAEPGTEEILASAERIHAAGDGEFLLAAAGRGEPEGVCQVRFRWSVWTSSHDCWIEDVFVRERARRSGLGRALVEAAIERARARGCARVELDVDEINGAALALYHSLGFAGDLKAEGRSLLLGRRL